MWFATAKGPEGLPLAAGVRRPLSARSKHHRLNVNAAFVSLLVPWALFCGVYALMAFHMHYEYPETCFMIVGLLALFVIMVGAKAGRTATRKMTDDAEEEPHWWAFGFLSCLVAWIVGFVLGRLTFWNYTQPYYNYLDLNQYDAVDPSSMSSEAFMDAGRVNFVDGSGVELRRSMGFRNAETYCVAPITVNGTALANYDFWVVGMGCCSSATADFHCGDITSARASSGLRLLDDLQRPFFSLAVRQAEETYAITARHPLFFYWTEDATMSMNWIGSEGLKYYVISLIVHFSWQSFCVLLALVRFSKPWP
jgi:hypothetical protein